MALCRVTLFGAPALQTEDGEVGAFGTRRAALLLAILALQPGRRFSRPELAERLWPDDEIETTSIRLRQELTRLRKLFGSEESAIVSEAGAISLDPARADSDTARFGRLLQAARRGGEDRLSRLAEAVEMATGLFMEGYADIWTLDERRRLLDAKVAALAELRDAAQGEEAVRWSRLAAEEDRLSERANLALVRCLAKAGQVPEALREFDRFSERLRAEIGLEPSPEAVAAVEELRRCEPSPAAMPRRLGRTLPVALTTLYGRDAEVERVASILGGGTRLTTLVGLGGVGKTRLAVALGARLEALYEDRVVFAPLADVRDGRAIVSKVLALIGTEGILGREDVGLVAASLPDAPTLLILDNLEHLGDAATRFVEEILGRKPRLQVLATSRRALGLVGERVVRLGPLELPEEGATDGLEAVPSVALFVERARNAQDLFELDARNAGVVGELVRRLGGLPLAIHLAASRARVMTPAQMLDQIDRHEDILVGRGTEFATERHRSLRAAMEWSLSLLGPAERRTFAALSVFKGGWTVESAAAVCDEPQALARIEELLDRSLVEPAPGDGAMRFRMLEPLREIGAAERDDALRRRHAAYFAETTEATFHRTFFTERAEMLRWYDAELGNLRAALAYGLKHDMASAYGLFAFCWRYFCIRGYYEEGRRWGAEIVARPMPEDGAANHARYAHAGYGVLLRDQGDHVPALERFEAAAAGYAADGLRERVAFCRSNATRSQCALGDYAGAVAGAREALEVWEGGPGKLPHTAFALTCLATGLRGLGRLDEAFETTERALRVHRSTGERWGLADGQYQHARSLAALHRVEEALRLLDDALAIFREIEEVDNLSRVQILRGDLLVRAGGSGAREALADAERLAGLIGNPTRQLVVGGLQARLRAEGGDPVEARLLARQTFACYAGQPAPPSLAFYLESVATAWDGDAADALRDLARRAATEGLDAQARLVEEAERALARE